MIIFVSGVTAGFGTAIAEREIANGHRVIGIGRRQDRLDALAERLGADFCGIALDLTQEDQILGLTRKLPPGFAEIDVLVNNAGLALGLDVAQKADLGDWHRMIATNVTGLTSLTHALLPAMVERNRGQVINIGSVAGNYPYPGGNVYGATKAYVRQFSLNLRADLAGTPLRVTNIEPGMVGGTEFSNVRFHGDDAKAAGAYAGVEPLTPQDIAEAVSWIIHLPKHVNINTIEIMPVGQTFQRLSMRAVS